MFHARVHLSVSKYCAEVSLSRGGGAWQEFPISHLGFEKLASCCRLFMITMKSLSGRTCVQLVSFCRTWSSDAKFPLPCS